MKVRLKMEHYDAVPMDTGIGIIVNPEIHPTMNQSLPEIALPPLEFPHPISLINVPESQLSISINFNMNRIT